jgi:hypothetical protein
LQPRDFLCDSAPEQTNGCNEQAQSAFALGLRDQMERCRMMDEGAEIRAIAETPPRSED